MTNSVKRLRILFALNILGAGLPGALITFGGNWSRENIFSTAQDPAMLGILGTIWFSIGIVSALGFYFPQTFKSVFLLQILYKSIWIVIVALPLLLQGRTDDVLFYVILFTLIVVVFSFGLFGEKIGNNTTNLKSQVETVL